jgi:hypothetical protein
MVSWALQLRCSKDNEAKAMIAGTRQRVLSGIQPSATHTSATKSESHQATGAVLTRRPCGAKMER